MGVLFNKKEDADLYHNAYNELTLILNASKKRTIISTPKQSQKAVFIPEKKGLMDKILDATIGPQVGYCIRCRKEMEFNPNRPLCSNCYTIWNKHANTLYKEKFCHHCGKEYQTSYEKPICYECFKSDFKYY